MTKHFSREEIAQEVIFRTSPRLFSPWNGRARSDHRTQPGQAEAAGAPAEERRRHSHTGRPFFSHFVSACPLSPAVSANLK